MRLTEVDFEGVRVPRVPAQNKIWGQKMESVKEGEEVRGVLKDTSGTLTREAPEDRPQEVTIDGGGPEAFLALPRRKTYRRTRKGNLSSCLLLGGEVTSRKRQPI